jgi:hypothetical protein
MSKSNYLEAAQLNEVLGGVAFAAPATVYVALHTADPAEDGSGAECTGGSYARVATTNNTTNWPNGNPKSNGTEILFPAPTAGWGIATHLGIWDALTGGNLLYYGALTVPKTINTGDEVLFGIGAIEITED